GLIAGLTETYRATAAEAILSFGESTGCADARTRARSHPESRGEADQVGHRFDLQLLHQGRAVRLDGSLGGAEFSCDLPVEPSPDDGREHFTLPFAERLESPAHLVELAAVRIGVRSGPVHLAPVKRHLERDEEVAFLEWFEDVGVRRGFLCALDR